MYYHFLETPTRVNCPTPTGGTLIMMATRGPIYLIASAVYIIIEGVQPPIILPLPLKRSLSAPALHS